MRWHASWRADPVAAAIADRHYNRQKIGAQQFVPPGRCVVLTLAGSTRERGGLWITSWPFAEYVQHAWGGAWVCSAFRNELAGEHLSSELILEAVAATHAVWPDPPAVPAIDHDAGEPFDAAMITFVDADKTRRKRDPGRCFRRAGFRFIGYTKAGLYAFGLPVDELPLASAALGSQEALVLDAP